MSSTVATHDQLNEPDSSPAPSGPAAPAPKAKRPRLYVLDGLRLVAALGVVLWHWLGVERFPAVWHGSPRHLMTVGHWIGAYSWTGVELFFLISGFVICMSCWGRSVGDFFTSRVVRLFPAYWVCVLLTSAVLMIVPVRWGDDVSRPTISRILSNLSMMDEPMGVNHIDPVYWTLWAETRFYVLFGVLLAVGLTYRRVLAFCGIWAFLALVAMNSNFPLLSNIIQPGYCWYFIGGITLFLMYRFGQNLLLWGMLIFCWLIAQNEIRGIYPGYAWGTGHSLKWSVVVALTTAAFALVTLAALGAFNRIQWKWLTVAGSLTYPLYLLHQQLGWEMITRVRRYLPPYPTLGVVLVTMLIAAYLVHRLVERPLAPLMKRKMEQAFDQVRRNGAPAGDKG
ncbi:acyltransferase family protein [Kitasatospora sp. NPDC058965]|uniref:acyltransferase family protein n=1 Tax=Kitasatospora sp. NPDC058965 TaxID=3346682 RepID=UPI0036BDE3A3